MVNAVWEYYKNKKKEIFMNTSNNKTRYVFISPHLDDAILSAGGLISYLKVQNKVKIITVFTKASKKINDSIQEFTQSCNYTNSEELFLNREEEDKKLCQYLKIDHLHLGFTDALWRDEYDSTEDVFSKRINRTKKERDLEKLIIQELKKKIKNARNTIIFAPLSIGNHVDHRIINRICRDNFTNVIYWEDYPYNLKSNLSEELVKKNSLLCFEFSKNLLIKEKLIKFYKSQIPILFGDKQIIIKKERYYFNLNKN